jgi:hypothetical protein
VKIKNFTIIKHDDNIIEQRWIWNKWKPQKIRLISSFFNEKIYEDIFGIAHRGENFKIKIARCARARRLTHRKSILKSKKSLIGK